MGETLLGVIPRGPKHLKVGITARCFALVALLLPVLWNGDTAAVPALLAIGSVWVVVTLLEVRLGVARIALVALESAAVGGLTGLVLEDSLAVLGAVAVPVFTAGLRRGNRGALVALSTSVLVLLAVALLVGGALTEEQTVGLLSWGTTALGLGLIGALLCSTLTKTSDPLAPYHYAQTLIHQLIDLSGGLDSGLDPVALGGAMLSAVGDELPTSVLVVHVPRGDSLAPLVSKTLTPGGDVSVTEDLAIEAWAVGSPLMDDRIFAFPLATTAGTTAVVSGVLSDRVDVEKLGVEERIHRLMRSLQATTVHLDTALLFAAFRDSATSEERRRLAREIHDGVAQDIASLGYLADALRAGDNTPQQIERIDLLRDGITTVVAEIRRSVVVLRTSVGAAGSLGAAIGSIARNLSEVSGTAIHVTLDEHTARLRPEVEAELFRITQEAMNNAVRHARATAIHVHCVVHSPVARITVADDGRGLQPAGPTSYGLEIMRERALLINAGLDLAETPGGGLSVTVQVPASHVPDPADPGVGRARIGA